MLKPASQRIDSIDLLRGIVIVIMALDHVRDYFHADAFLFDPTDMTRTTAPLFFTRWITHFCAPVFIFLAGTSAYQVMLRKGNAATSVFLLKRGLWLIVLEISVINFGWFFNVHFSFIALIVIWSLGVGMILLAGLLWIPKRFLLIMSLVVIACHNAFDGVQIDGRGLDAVLWALLHKQDAFMLGADHVLFFGYGLIPWVAVMSLGYCFGELYTAAVNPVQRRNRLVQMGLASIVFFIVLRGTNVYGDPHPWAVQNTAMHTFLSFFNCTKYPPSLLYLAMTLGPALLVLAATENVVNRFTGPLTVFGRVPLFFYVIHIYLIHIVALVAAIATGFPASSMIFDTWITNSEPLRGYGFPLSIVYLLWSVLIVSVYPLCRWFDTYKRGHREKWWLSYL